MQLDVENQLERVTEAITEIDNRINEVFGYRANNIIARPYKINWKEETIDIVYKIIGLRKIRNMKLKVGKLMFSQKELLLGYPILK